MVLKTAEIKARRMNILKEIFISFKYQFGSYRGSLATFSIVSGVLLLLTMLIYAVLIGHASFNLQSIISSIKPAFGNGATLFSYSFQIVWYLAVIIAALLGGAILPEVGSRYSYFLFVQPSRRSSIIIGRYIAAFIGSAIVMAVYYILAVLISVYLFSSVPFFPLLISFAETLLIILAILAFIVFIGASSDNPMAASMTAMFLLLFGFYFLMLILPIAYPTMEPWFMLNYAAESTYNGFSGTFQHVIVSNQSVQHQPPLPVVSGLNGFNVLSANCNAAGKNGNNYIVMILSDNFIGAIQLDWINFTLSNGTKISQPFENQTFPQGATFGVPVEAVANCSIPTSTPYVIGIRISYSQQGVSQPLNSLGTIYLNESDISPTYTYLTMDSYEPYPSESAEIATGYMIFFLSLGLLIYGRREVK